MRMKYQLVVNQTRVEQFMTVHEAMCYARREFLKDWNWRPSLSVKDAFVGSVNFSTEPITAEIRPL